MGKRNRSKGPTPIRVAGTANQKVLSADELLQAAEDAIATNAIQEAETVLRYASGIYSSNATIWSKLGELLLNEGNVTHAELALRKSIELDSVGSATPYLNLAQILQNEQSFDIYLKAIEILDRDLASLVANGTTSGESYGEMVDAICSAHCACAELFLTDLCYHEQAENYCEFHLTKALSHNNAFVEAYQLLASFRMSQQRIAEALTAISNGYQLWTTLDPELWPEFEVRAEYAKIFLELNDYIAASRILGRLVKEIDTIAELWYLLAYAEFRRRRFYRASDAMDMAVAMLERLKGDPFEEEDAHELREKVESLQRDVVATIASLGEDHKEEDSEEIPESADMDDDE